MQPTTQTRPTGVTILAILAAIGGVLGILGGLALIGLGGLAAASTGFLGGLIAIFGIIALVQAVLSLAFAYGAWMLKPWGWTLGIVVEVIGIALSLLFIVDGDSTITSQAISIVIGVAIIYYLFTPAVKTAFGRA
jgi:uncharacterized membrane protein (DUF2068 family)